LRARWFPTCLKAFEPEMDDGAEIRISAPFGVSGEGNASGFASLKIVAFTAPIPVPPDAHLLETFQYRILAKVAAEYTRQRGCEG
jgi:hypothetical protein